VTGSAAHQTDQGLPGSSDVVTEETFAAQPAPLPDTTGPQDQPPAQDGEADKAQPPADEPKAPTPEPDAAAKRSDPQKRIDKLTRKLRDAEREAAYLKGRLEAWQAQGGSREAGQPAAEADPTPKLDDFESVEEFAEARADWLVRNPEARKSSAPKQPAPGAQDEPKGTQREAEPTTAAAPSEDAVKSYIAAKAKYPDLDDVLFDTDLPWTKTIADAVDDQPDSAEILYHLGKDEDELERIAALSPKQQAREVWRFAEKYRAGQPAAASPTESEPDSDAEPAPEPRAKAQPGAVVSKAAPVPTVLSGRASASVDLETLSDEEYIAHMNQQEAARRRRR